MSVLPRAFYSRPTLTVARDLLGKIFTVRRDNEFVAGRIVEVEAYHQSGDHASHSSRGNTPRNAVMFGPPGHLYVYFTYGMHFCMNVVTEPAGTGAAVLIRAVEPVAGIDVMQKRRGAGIAPRDLTNGPAKCCQAFGITRECNGLDLRRAPVTIADAPPVPDGAVATSPRIGITRSLELPWRFYLADSPYVSRTSPRTSS